MTELTERKRLDKDQQWFVAEQKEFRDGSLSEETHAFLHGYLTSVHGSYYDGACSCGNLGCLKLVNDKPETILQKECSECALERKRRTLVITDETDDRPTIHFLRTPTKVQRRSGPHHLNPPEYYYKLFTPKLIVS